MRTTRTNSGPDSKGVVRFGRWELEGEAYLFVVAGAILAVLVFALSASWGFAHRIIFGALPLLASIAWVKTFVLGKPPHYLGDWIEKRFAGPHFDMQRPRWALLRAPCFARRENL